MTYWSDSIDRVLLERLAREARPGSSAAMAPTLYPGQGVLTMLIGISMLDFPGKREVEAKLIGQPTVLSVINSMRQKFNKPPLRLAPDL